MSAYSHVPFLISRLSAVTGGGGELEFLSFSFFRSLYSQPLTWFLDVLFFISVVFFSLLLLLLRRMDER